MFLTRGFGSLLSLTLSLGLLGSVFGFDASRKDNVSRSKHRTGTTVTNSCSIVGRVCSSHTPISFSPAHLLYSLATGARMALAASKGYLSTVQTTLST